MGAVVLGYAFGLALSALTAWGIYSPPPPVAEIIRYQCPPQEVSRLTLQDVYFEVYYLTPPVSRIP